LVSKKKQEERNSFFFSIDIDRNFTKTLFSGYENSLFIWNTATFLFVDYFAFNYVLAAIITYLLNLVRIIFDRILIYLFLIDCRKNACIIRTQQFIKKDINSKEFSYLNI
jgi:hypothetical protein